MIEKEDARLQRGFIWLRIGYSSWFFLTQK
jgi:hypothetical protein